ncbi:MAG: hypothetical protein KGL39_04495 [Patescibacteria group bacterium]|nr:hypothetical protein [Patescibacteria group bacterium]
MQMLVDCDLSATTISDAARMLGGAEIHDLHLFCGPVWRIWANKLQGEYGFDLTIIPDALLINGRAWCVKSGNDYVWTNGAM